METQHCYRLALHGTGRHEGAIESTKPAKRRKPTTCWKRVSATQAETEDAGSNLPCHRIVRLGPPKYALAPSR